MVSGFEGFNREYNNLFLIKGTAYVTKKALATVKMSELWCKYFIGIIEKFNCKQCSSTYIWWYNQQATQYNGFSKNHCIVLLVGCITKISESSYFWDITKDLKNKVTDGDNIDPRLSFFIISSLYFYTACMHFVSLEF